MENKKRKSPLKAKPHRYAGQSIDEAIQRTVDDHLLPWVLGAGYLLVLAVYEWVRFYADLPPQPILVSVIAGAGLAFTAIRYFSVKRKMAILNQARDGERAVGQFLEGLRASGCYIFHDIQGKGFNLDHVLVSPKGIFSIETKSFSKPHKGDAKIQIDSDAVIVNGFNNTGILIQAKAQKAWLGELMTKLMGKKIDARTAVLFPGWFVEGRFLDAKVWALNPKALSSFLASLPDQYSAQEVRQIANTLSMYLRESY